MGSGGQILIVGSGGHARAVLDVVRSQGRYDAVGFIDGTKPKGSPCLGGLRVIGSEADLPDICRDYRITRGLVAVGDNFQRRALTERLLALAPAFEIVSAVHPSAVVARDTILGPGTVVMPGAVVVSGSRLGRGCLVNTRASLDHDGVMEDFASLAPGAVTGGGVHLGACAAVGLGASVIHGCRIGAHAVVGAGAVVLDDIPPEVVAFGVPALVVRSRAPDEPYL
jgi:sugar O-acyltransferase (sialic acid O-acetyltransferase NeuD family)